MKHILFTLKECPSELLDDEGYIRDVVFGAARECRSTLLALNSHKFDPQGVTCVAMLAESHISIHTWPEKGYAAVDIFTCGDHTAPDVACRFMSDALESKHPVYTVIYRGI